MRNKKQKRVVEKRNPKQKEPDKTISALRGELATTKKALDKSKDRADRWRQQAKDQKRAAQRARARIEKLQRKLAGASDSSAKVQAAPMAGLASVTPVAESTTVDVVAVPDETWSFVQLRAEARARGLTGMSNKTKAQLLTALS